jgi:hypothetical protein
VRTLFLNDRQQLRNGWWIAIFVVCIAVTRVLHGPLKNVLKSLGVYDAWRHPLLVLMILLATWACMRMRRQPLSTIGLRLDRRWASELACGSALGIAMMALTTAMIAATGAVRFELDPSHGIGALAIGLYVFGFAALLEELLFRGFVFQRLIDGIGAWARRSRWRCCSMPRTRAIRAWKAPRVCGRRWTLASQPRCSALRTCVLAYLRTCAPAHPRTRAPAHPQPRAARRPTPGLELDAGQRAWFRRQRA